jgi:DNA (cytosine-5)-methyltransferase 1
VSVTITYGSLCTGYDGIGMGLRLAGLAIDERFCAEIEPSVAGLLTSRNIGDIKAADWADVEPVELLSSGDPCQSVSVAGRREGRDDPRFLWPDVRRAYRALRPKRIFLENVWGIVSHDGGRTLAERFDNLRGDGYAVRWTVLGACAVGAPHHRHRWYALATRVGANPGPAMRVGRKAYCGAPRSGGRTLLPTPSAADGPGVSDKRLGGMNLRTAATLLPTPRATDGTNGGPGQRGSSGDLAMPSAVQPQNWAQYADAVALWEEITGVSAPAPTVPGPNGGVRLNPALPEWMMGLPPGTLTDRMKRNDALKAAGNGVVPLAVAAAWRMLSE